MTIHMDIMAVLSISETTILGKINFYDKKYCGR